MITLSSGLITTQATAGFRKMLARLGQAAKIGCPIHPHMLRHGTGYKLANDGVDTRATQPQQVRTYGFQPGHPRYGGRRKGSAGKLNVDLRQQIYDAAAATGYIEIDKETGQRVATGKGGCQGPARGREIPSNFKAIITRNHGSG
jgi:Phage integrase family